MRKLALLILALLLAGFALYSTIYSGDVDDGAREDPIAAETTGSEAPPSKQSAPSPANPKNRADAGTRHEVAATISGVDGRCIDAETGSPIAGCAITVGDFKNWVPQSHRDSNLRKWECTTGADGMFTCDVEGANPDGVTLRAKIDGRVTVLRSPIIVRQAKRTDVGDIQLQIGC